MENGQLVPDEIITDLVMEALQTHGGNTHWILDGMEISCIKNGKKIMTSSHFRLSSNQGTG
jgi:adenylate kinase family enzyme